MFRNLELNWLKKFFFRLQVDFWVGGDGLFGCGWLKLSFVVLTCVWVSKPSPKVRWWEIFDLLIAYDKTTSTAGLMRYEHKNPLWYQVCKESFRWKATSASTAWECLLSSSFFTKGKFIKIISFTPTTMAFERMINFIIRAWMVLPLYPLYFVVEFFILVFYQASEIKKKGKKLLSFAAFIATLSSEFSCAPHEHDLSDMTAEWDASCDGYSCNSPSHHRRRWIIKMYTSTHSQSGF